MVGDDVVDPVVGAGDDGPLGLPVSTTTVGGSDDPVDVGPVVAGGGGVTVSADDAVGW